MKHELIKISDSFWNIRGSYKIKGLIDVGTQASLVKIENGKFIFLDSLTLKGDVLKQVDKLTNGGRDVEAVLNLHPFHTLHVEYKFKKYPNAKHYGTARHLSMFPELKWEDLKTEDIELHQMFSLDLEFSVPRGVDFISNDQSVHFSSVLAYHRSSKTIHVDDTFMYINLPKIMNLVGISDPISFHPTLSKALETRKGATVDFVKWARELAECWSDAENLCAAHMASLIKDKKNKDVSIKDSILKALDKVSDKLEKHKKEFG
jgi:hypothetical protein